MADDVADLQRRLDAGEGLRLGQVATLTGRGRTTIHDWIKTGKWKPRYTRTLGGQRHFRAEDVQALLNELRAEEGDSGSPASAD